MWKTEEDNSFSLIRRVWTLLRGNGDRRVAMGEGRETEEEEVSLACL